MYCSGQIARGIARRSSRVSCLSGIAALLLIAGCDYVRLLRPNTLKQLNPRVVALVDELPNVDQPNKEIFGRLFAHGGLGHATDGSDGMMHAHMWVPPQQFMWYPSIIVMPHAGTLELEIANEDQNFHMAFLPSDGERQVLELPSHTRGLAHITLDQPGLYWFGCPVADHAGRGMLGLIIVQGDVANDAKLDRPRQRRPGE